MLFDKQNEVESSTIANFKYAGLSLCIMVCRRRRNSIAFFELIRLLIVSPVFRIIKNWKNGDNTHLFF